MANHAQNPRQVPEGYLPVLKPPCALWHGTPRVVSKRCHLLSRTMLGTELVSSAPPHTVTSAGAVQSPPRVPRTGVEPTGSNTRAAGMADATPAATAHSAPARSDLIDGHSSSRARAVRRQCGSHRASLVGVDPSYLEAAQHRGVGAHRHDMRACRRVPTAEKGPPQRPGSPATRLERFAAGYAIEYNARMSCGPARQHNNPALCGDKPEIGRAAYCTHVTHMKKILASVALALLAGCLLPRPALGDGSCGEAANLTHNCNFDRFVDISEGDSTRVVPEGWTPWVTMGNPAFVIDDHGSLPGAPAQIIWSEWGTWTAGLYQQVEVTPGHRYIANIQWVPLSVPAAPPNQPLIQRRVGIDPTGGVDPLSSAVVWGPSVWLEEKIPDLRVGAVAQAPAVTVYVWTHHGQSYGQDQVFLDAVTLVEDPSFVPSPTVPPTATRRPPTRTPKPKAATPTMAASPTEPLPPPTEPPAPTATTTPEPPSPTPSPAPSDTPPPPPPTMTPSPTQTPTVTPVPVVQIAITPDERAPSRSGQTTGGRIAVASLFLVVALAAVAGAILLGSLFLWLFLRSRRV